MLKLRRFQRIYGPPRLKRWFEENQGPQNDTLCQGAVWLTQTMLPGSPADTSEIADAVEKIHTHAGELARG